MKFKKVLAVGLAGALSLSLAACGGSSSSTTSTATDTASGTQAAEDAGSTAASGVVSAFADAANTEKTDKTLTVSLASEPSALWGAPVAKTENECNILSAALLDTLVAKDYTTNEVKPNLATEWEWVDDTHLKMTLRDDVKMASGNMLTADDVVYTVGVWTEYSASTDTGRFVVGAEAEDEHTVVIEFTAKSPALLEMLTWSNFGIVSEADVEAAGGLEKSATNPVIGSGKYKFVEWKNGQSITLERNEDYWNTDYAGYYQKIVCTFTNDPAAREMAVESGDAQVANDMPIAQAATYVSKDNIQVGMYTFGQISHLWYNMTEEHATSDLALRQAIDKALDFDALAQVGTAGYGKPALGYFEETSPYYNATYTTEERKADAEAAKKILEDAGIPTDGSVEITALGMQDTVPMYTVMQENLRNIGITLNIESVDTPTFVQAAFGGDFDIIIVGEYTAERYPTLIPFLRSANIASGFVIGGPKTTTDEIDSLIQEAIEETDQAAAKEKLGELEQIMKEQNIVSNLYPEMHAVVLGSNIKGLATIERGLLSITEFYEG